jgi:hypothetical protein
VTAPAAPRYHYRAFGRSLSSTIEFPELAMSASTVPHWTFEVVSPGGVSTGGRLLGEEPLYKGVGARLYEHALGHRVEVDDTGSYDITAGGSNIRWLPRADPWWDFGRGHLLGRVLATAMHFAGLLVLHGSAVRTRDGVVAFLGLKGAGKSSLALALVASGARHATDDTLPIALGADTATVWPGIHSVRLHPDMLERPDLRGTPVLGAGRDGKHATAPLNEARVMTEPAPLRAIYLLHPAVSNHRDRLVDGAALDPLRSTASLAAFAKVGRMIGAGEAKTLLDRAGEVARLVPVESLLVHRDLDRLPEVAAEILSWHGGVEARPEG